LLKLAAASAFLDGRDEPDPGDLFVLRYAWNSPEQAETIDAIVRPLVDSYRRQRADGRAVAGRIEDILAELARIRDLLRNAGEISDVQLFSQLRALGGLRTALSSLPGDAAARALRDIDALLDGVFAGTRPT
jgi:MoxR-like ATPase